MPYNLIKSLCRRFTAQLNAYRLFNLVHLELFKKENALKVSELVFTAGVNRLAWNFLGSEIRETKRMCLF